MHFGAGVCKNEPLEGIGASEVERDMGLFREALDRHYSNVDAPPKIRQVLWLFIHSFIPQHQ